MAFQCSVEDILIGFQFWTLATNTSSLGYRLVVVHRGSVGSTIYKYVCCKNAYINGGWKLLLNEVTLLMNDPKWHFDFNFNSLRLRFFETLYNLQELSHRHQWWISIQVLNIQRYLSENVHFTDPIYCLNFFWLFKSKEIGCQSCSCDIGQK